MSQRRRHRAPSDIFPVATWVCVSLSSCTVTASTTVEIRQTRRTVVSHHFNLNILFSHVHACVVLKHRPAELQAVLWKYTFPKGVAIRFNRSRSVFFTLLLYLCTMPFSAKLDSSYLCPVCVLFCFFYCSQTCWLKLVKHQAGGKKRKIHSPWWSHAKVPCGDCGEISVGSEGKASSKPDGLGDGQSRECCKHREWHVAVGVELRWA